MTQSSNLWTQRWDSIQETLYILLDRYGSSERGTRRENTIASLLNQLLIFGQHQFWFFYDGLLAQKLIQLDDIVDDPGLLQSSLPLEFQRYNTGYPIHEHVLAVTLSQIVEDVAVLQRASEQRDVSGLGVEKGRVGQQAIFFTLEDVDKLTYAGLKMLRPYLSTEETFTVLTYFRRSANVRVLPYAPVALIGVPLTGIGLSTEGGVSTDLLAIPHELGHHLYWNGTTDGSLDVDKRFYRVVPDLIAATRIGHWTEEVFADVVGCLVGGPAVARSFADMQRAYIGTRFIDSADVHPTPALRPYLYARVLQHMGLTASAGALIDEWEGHLAERRVYANREHLADGQRAVDIILDQFDLTQFSDADRWSSNEDYVELYEAFDTRWPVIAASVNDDDFDPTSIEPLPAWSDQVTRLLGNSTISSLPEDWTSQVDSSENSDQIVLQLPADQWLRIFDFGGWTTEGPNIKGHG